MKKITALLLVCIMMLTLAACGDKDSDNQELTQATTFEAIVATEPTTKARPVLTAEDAAKLFNKAYVQARIWLTFYNEYWDQSDYFTGDNEYDYYYRINHESINSVGALQKHLAGYFSQRLVDELVAKAYVERDGKLYHHCFIAGDAMPTYLLDETTAELVSQSENKATYNITLKSDRSNFVDAGEDPYGFDTKSLTFVYENNRWLIDDYFTINLYPSYVLNGVKVN